MRFNKMALLRGFAVVVVAMVCGLLAAPSWGFDTIFFNFDEEEQFTNNFYSVPLSGGGFAYSAGLGSDGNSGRMSLHSNGTAKDVAIYDTTPDEFWGPDNTFKNMRITVDFKFTPKAYSGDPDKQFFGIMFNIDQYREDDTLKDCLVFQIRNVDHAEEQDDPTDMWTLRRGRANSPDWGDTLYSDVFANPIDIREDDLGGNWYQLEITLQNDDYDTTLDFEAKVYDLLDNSLVNTVTLTGLSYSYDLIDAATQGEIGIIANDSGASSNSVKWDNFKLEDLNASPDVPGDANRDGQVDGSDVTILANNWQYGVTPPADATWDMGDFNGDGMVDGSDVTILANNWQYGVTTSAAIVPEPSTVMLLLGALVSLVAIHRKK